MQRSQMRLEGISEGIHLDIGTLKRGGSVARIKFRRIKSIHSSQSFAFKMRVNIIFYQIKQIHALITQRKK